MKLKTAAVPFLKFSKVKKHYLKCKIYCINTRHLDCFSLAIEPFTTSRMYRQMNFCTLFLKRKKKVFVRFIRKRKIGFKNVLRQKLIAIMCSTNQKILLMFLTSIVLINEERHGDCKLLEGSISLGRIYALFISLKMPELHWNSYCLMIFFYQCGSADLLEIVELQTTDFFS